MNKLIIDHTSNIDSNILEKVAKSSPWEWLEKQLLLKEPTDERVGFVKANVSSIILNEKWDLISYWAFWNGNRFWDKIIEKLWFNISNTLLWIYLFTTQEYRNKWFAWYLKWEQIKYIKKNYPNIKYLVWETEYEDTLELYKKYWAEEIKLDNHKFYPYYYKI